MIKSHQQPDSKEAGHGVLICNARYGLWRTFPDQRVEVLMDADQYFRHLYTNLKTATKQIIIVGWDIDSRLALLRSN